MRSGWERTTASVGGSCPRALNLRWTTNGLHWTAYLQTSDLRVDGSNPSRRANPTSLRHGARRGHTEARRRRVLADSLMRPRPPDSPRRPGQTRRFGPSVRFPADLFLARCGLARSTCLVKTARLRLRHTSLVWLPLSRAEPIQIQNRSGSCGLAIAETPGHWAGWNDCRRTTDRRWRDRRGQWRYRVQSVVVPMRPRGGLGLTGRQQPRSRVPRSHPTSLSRRAVLSRADWIPFCC